MSAEIFKPASKTIKKIFGDADSFYEVPDYQRPYQWEDDQVEQLWDDLFGGYVASKESDASNETYFLGSLILIRNAGHFDIVDGQQRLTTLTILFSVIRDLYPALDPRTFNAIKNSIADMVDDKQRLRFTTAIDRQNEFEQLIVKKVQFRERLTKQEKKQHPYLNTALIFREKLSGITAPEVKEFITYIFESVQMISIICENRSVAIKLFQVLNARGLDLSASDLIKSFLMNKLPENKRDQFIATWRSIGNSAKSAGETIDSMLNYYLYFLKGSNPKQGLYDELVALIKSRDANEVIFEFSGFIEAYKEVLHTPNRFLFTLRYLPHELYWKTVLTTAKFLEMPDFDHLCRCIRNFYYSHWIAGYSSSKIKQPSFNIIQLLKQKKSILDIDAFVSEISDKNNLDARITQALLSPAYSERWLKPLLLAIEYSQTDRVSEFIELEKSLHVEHVLPVKSQTIPYWAERYTETEAKRYCNTIANLTLLSGRKNILASNSAFPAKVDVYKGKGSDGLSSFRITQMIHDDHFLEGREWKKECLERRFNWIKSQIRSEFSLDLAKVFFNDLSKLNESYEDQESRGREATQSSFHQECIDEVNGHNGTRLLKKSNSVYHDETTGISAICKVSRRHGESDSWFRFSLENKALLEAAPDRNFVIFGCGSSKELLILSGTEFLPLLEKLNVTDNDNVFYYHVQFESLLDRHFLKCRGGERIEVTKFALGNDRASVA